MKTTMRWGLLGVWALAGCASWDPRAVDVALETSQPETKITSYTRALEDLGLMTEIYRAPTLRLQCLPVGDNTGTSLTSGAEIPRDVTEMMKSALNSIGGKVVYIPYDPGFLQAQAATGYSSFENKVVPDAVVSGGITEFDRGLVMRGKNTDADASAEFSGLPDSLPSKSVEFRSGSAAKSGLARITLDFNLLDLQTMAGIPRMNVTNSLEVHKALKERELGVSLFGQTFGLKGSVKKVEGRHAAVRLLVELSMIQLVGRHLRLPYWRLLGEDAAPDPYVLREIENFYRCLGEREALLNVQAWLALHGHRVPLTGVLDGPTRVALKQVCPDFDLKAENINFNIFREVYTHVPIDFETKRLVASTF